MIGLAVLADAAVFHFHEIADMRLIFQHGARADARIRSDAAIPADLRAINHAIRQKLGAGGDLHVFQHAMRADTDPVAQGYIPFEHAADVYFNISAASQFPAHINARRISERHAPLKQLVGALPLIQALELRKLRFAVDSQRFPLMLRLNGGNFSAVLDRQRYDVGKVVFLLRVFVAEPA